MTFNAPEIQTFTGQAGQTGQTRLTSNPGLETGNWSQRPIATQHFSPTGQYGATGQYGTPGSYGNMSQSQYGSTYGPTGTNVFNTNKDMNQ